MVDSLAERLEVTGFNSKNEETDKILWEWWSANNMDAQQGLAYTWAARDGMSYVIVSWDNEMGIPRFDVNQAWDGEDGVKVKWAGAPYPGQKIHFASKRWSEDFDASGNIEKMRRLNLYLPDSIDKYSGAADTANEYGWQRHWDEDDTEGTWPIPWVDEAGEPLGIPVVPFLNKQVGLSELKDVTPLQVVLNKAMLDLLGAADVEGFGIFTKTGGALLDNPDIFPGAMWQDEDPLAQFGKLPGAELGGLIQMLATAERTVATVTRRPMTYFDPTRSTSGEHLKQMEAPLVAQVKAGQTVFGNAWAEAMKMAIRLDNEFGEGTIGDIEGLSIEPQWQDAETRNDKEVMEIVTAKLEAGIIDLQQAWDELGYTEDQKNAMLERMEEEQIANEANIVAGLEGIETGEEE